MKDNVFEPGALIIGEVSMGTGNYFAPGCVIYGPIIIGNNNFFGPNCVVGAAPQDEVISMDSHIDVSMGKSNVVGSIRIGNNNVIREFVTIHRGQISETEIHDEVYLMAYSHIAHDCRIQSKVKITNAVQLGGYSTISYGANIGLSSTLHQWSVVGAYAMIGMNSTVTKNIPPGCLALGSPIRVVRPNVFSLQKIGITEYNWWESYQTNLKHSEVPKVLIDHIEFYENEILFRSHQKEISKDWRLESAKTKENLGLGLDL